MKLIDAARQVSGSHFKNFKICAGVHATRTCGMERYLTDAKQNFLWQFEVSESTRRGEINWLLKDLGGKDKNIENRHRRWWISFVKYLISLPYSRNISDLTFVLPSLWITQLNLFRRCGLQNCVGTTTYKLSFTKKPWWALVCINFNSVFPQQCS